ncbi:RHS repeat-associated core domain-containing protein [Salmonella enterica]|uniref:RHS repeat-associated core domain-containing protein n=1 Tax=Salmonella enterica TaxID=28901 RepID=UPI003CC54681
MTAVIYGGERGGEIRHGLERDAAGRLTAKITPETRTEYRYDAADRLLEIRRRRHDAAEGGEPEVIRFSYDSAGNLLSEETAQGVLQNRYDVQGNRTETQMPDGRTLRYLYYGSGHLQQINLGRDVISEFTRDHLHREVQRSQGRLDTRRMYDRTGRLTRKLTCKGMRGVVPETFIDREYAYSGQDELLKKRHSRQGVTDYFYDTTGRITACRNEAYLDSWQYDAAANLLDRRQGETAQAGAGSVVPFNRITSYRGLHYRYDEYGRVVEKRGRNGTQHYRWNAEHRLTEVAVIRGSTVRRYGYVYDAPGRRVEKHELDAEGKPYNRTTFLWDGMRLAQECRLGRSSSLYIYSDQGSHEPLARVDRAAPGEADEVLYYHTDVNGAPEEMTDGGGNIVWEAGYQVWGNLTHEKETRPVQQNLRFQGQYLDRETGLHYNLYRFYDPDIGKFISGDPIGLRGGLNLYQYAPNPLSWIDPLGLATVDVTFEMNGEIFTGSNPTERTPRGGGKTLPGLGYPNNDRYSMHAEIDAMMKAHDKGMRGGKGVLTVEGLPVCDFCKRSLKNMAQHLGLEDFTVHEKSTGLTYRFKGNDLHPVRKGGKGFKGCGIK